MVIKNELQALQKELSSLAKQNLQESNESIIEEYLKGKCDAYNISADKIRQLINKIVDETND